MPTMTRAGYTPPKAEIPKEPPRAPKHSKKKKKKRKLRISGTAAVSLVIFLIALAVGAATIFVYTETQPYVGTYLPGTSLDNYPLAGATQEDAFQLLARTTGETIAAWRLEMTYMGQSYSLTARDVALAVDEEATLDPLWQHGREGNMLARYLQMLNLRQNPVNAKPVITYDMAAVDALLERVCEDVEREPVDATMTFAPGSSEPFRFTQEQIGLTLNTKPLRAQIEKAIASMTPLEMVLVPQVLEPHIYQVELENAAILRHRLVMEIAADEASYLNVQLAAGKLHGAVIDAGKTLSFNETVGARSAQAGYVEAPEPAYGQDVRGVGGGVCQASTALYRAALLAGLSVAERNAAVRPVAYCEIGQEAAVSDQGLDLVIENTTAHALFLTARTYQEGKKAYLELQIIGEPLETRYALESASQAIPAPEDPVYVRDHEGKYARYKDERVEAGEPLEGYTASVSRVTLDEDGEEATSETISEDRYEPIPPAIYVGMEEREKEAQQ